MGLPLYKILLGLFFMTVIKSCSFSTEQILAMFEDAKREKFDIIIVPGVPFEDNEWGEIMKIRVYWSKYLYDLGIAENIMYSGAAVYSPYYEAEIMALYAQAIGIPKQNIYTETKAEHSTENVYYSFKKARNLGFKNIALATDPYQAKLLKGFIQKSINGNIAIIPIVYDTLRPYIPDVASPAIDYNKAFKAKFVAISDRESLWIRMNGTRGKNIDTTAYNDIVPLD